ncbi:MAG: shikimate kinase [Bacteroidales bacterium]|nr:shikimate kinase [Bacteroidales bacterium]
MILPIDELAIRPIFLVGFMKSGKTTIGRLIAKRLNRTFIDLDEYIEEKLNQKISVLIREKGLTIFRKEETRALKEVVRNYPTNSVIATGGGIVDYKVNRIYLPKHGYVVWLFSSLNELMKRQDNKDRPLWNNDVTSLFYSRIYHYSEIADEIIITDGKSIEEVVRYVVGQ